MLRQSLDSSSQHEPLVLQQIAYDFRQEVASREAFETYCQWYYAQALKHQVELDQMKHDIPLFHWFNRHRS